MTTVKLDSKTSANAAAGLEPYIGQLYATPGKRVVGVIEMAHVERTQPAPDSDKQPSVKLKITHLELANPEQEEALREAMRALFLHRTAQGTLGEDGEIELTERTLERTGGLLHAVEAARLRAAVLHWREQIRRALAIPNITVAEMRHELDTVADGLSAVLRATDWDSKDGDD